MTLLIFTNTSTNLKGSRSMFLSWVSYTIKYHPRIFFYREERTLYPICIDRWYFNFYPISFRFLLLRLLRNRFSFTLYSLSLFKVYSRCKQHPVTYHHGKSVSFGSSSSVRHQSPVNYSIIISIDSNSTTMYRPTFQRYPGLKTYQKTSVDQ